MASNDLNKVMLLGNIGKAPEVREFNDGKRFLVKFTLATNERYKDKQSGDWMDDTTWHNIVVFNEHWGKVVRERCGVGTRVYVEGQVKTRKYKKEGSEEERYITEIILPMYGGEIKIQARGKDQGESDVGSEEKSAASDEFDDDIPF